MFIFVYIIIIISHLTVFVIELLNENDVTFNHAPIFESSHLQSDVMVVDTDIVSICKS